MVNKYDMTVLLNWGNQGSAIIHCAKFTNNLQWFLQGLSPEKPLFESFPFIWEFRLSTENTPESQSGCETILVYPSKVILCSCHL